MSYGDSSYRTSTAALQTMRIADETGWASACSGSSEASGQNGRLAVILLAAGVACLAIDVPVAAWFASENVPGSFEKLLTLAEVFAHGLGVAGILATVAVLDARVRKLLPRLIVAAYGAGLAANLGKLCLSRQRPRHFAMDDSVWASFHGWFPMISGAHHDQGFPSAHAATAFGLAMALCWLYPHGRGWFSLLALLAAGQRAACGAHFLSDCLIGAGVGCGFATFYLFWLADTATCRAIESRLLRPFGLTPFWAETKLAIYCGDEVERVAA